LLSEGQEAQAKSAWVALTAVDSDVASASDQEPDRSIPSTPLLDA
jgi:hypothetical protein